MTRTMRAAPVSVVIPTFREVDNIGQVLRDLRDQTMPPSEVIIVDACSDDGTTGEAERMAHAFQDLRVLWAPRALPGRGRNVGIEASRHDVVLLLDAGLRIPHDWVESLAQPLLRGVADVAFGGFVPDARTAVDDVLELLTACNACEIDGRVMYYPTTASIAMRRSVWQSAGRFPEGLRACEDSVFFQRLYALGHVKPTVCPRAVVRWSMGKGFRYVTRKMFQGSQGEVRAGIISRKMVFLFGLYPMILALLSVAPVSLWMRFALVTVLMCWRVGRLARKNPWAMRRLLKRRFGIPAIVALVPWADLVAMFGYAQAYVRTWWEGRFRLPRVRLYRPIEGSTRMATQLPGK
ncbi:MAG: glycosyltransferase [Planctomycetes bacterium]|nr:glycosyltransferase [Planctomycetota bacterium]